MIPKRKPNKPRINEMQVDCKVHTILKSVKFHAKEYKLGNTHPWGGGGCTLIYSTKMFHIPKEPEINFDFENAQLT